MKEPTNERDKKEPVKKDEIRSQLEEIFAVKEPAPAPKKKMGKAVAVAAVIFALCLALVGGYFLIDHLISSEPEKKSPAKTEEKKETVEEEVKPNPIIEDDEIRGVYIASVSNINFPSRSGLSVEQLEKELDAIVENSVQIGFDTLYFQVRPSADALYDSELFPTSRYLTGKEGEKIDFDPLKYLIGKASEYEIDVVAWVNPYRVTASKAKNKNAALATLSDDNFAKQNPDHTVFYGGKLYYNPASAEVRRLIADGVKEICEGYDVAGILYDDYFYPYPVEKEKFDDADSYKKANTELSLEDWRRENVNQMVKLTYETVKGVSEDLSFGISPFGIWKNASSDPRGSDTRGLEAYSSLYCDALAWIEGGYIDYVSPQIYWERGYSVADFATLTRWWSAQVDGTGVKLVISHAAYRAGDFKAGGTEIAQQIQYARSFMGSCGNIQYGYADVAKNTAGVRDALTELYRTPYKEETAEESIEKLSFVFPGKGVKTTNSAHFVTAKSDPRYPVYSETGKIGRTKSGFFSLLMPLSVGKNTLTLTQNGVDYSFSITRITSSAPSTLKKFQIQSVTPSEEKGVLAMQGIDIPVSVTAPKGCTVSVRLGDKTVSLDPTLKQKGEGTYIKEVYKGSITVPPVEDATEPVSVGKLFYTVSSDEKQLTHEGAEVKVIPASLSMVATVTKDYSHLKISADSSFYDDYTPASVGMKDRVVASYDGFYQLAFGGFVAAENAILEEKASCPAASLTEIKHSVKEKTCDFKLALNTPTPLTVNVREEQIELVLFATETELKKEIALDKNGVLFRSASVSFDQESGNTVLTLKLLDARNYYGFDYAYTEDGVTFSFRKPSSLEEGEKPLTGKRIVIDAGHGGTDSGALGYLTGYNEKDLNLSIALVLRDKLKELGAEVLMTRGDDTTVSLTERMDFLTREDPDFAISVHHNSVNEATDPNTARGTLGLYWSPAGLSLAEYVQRGVPKALSVQDLGIRAQKLAVCRNHRFPQTLVETDFICAPAEYEAAIRGDYSEICAQAMADGVLDWYRMQEGFLKGSVA